MKLRTKITRKIFVATLLFILLSFTAISLAQESSPDEDEEATKSAVNEEKVQELKEKLETKVEELREEQERGFYGTIAALSKTSFTLATNGDEVRVRYGDDAQVFELGQKTVEAEIEDLENTQNVSVLGFYDATEELHHAKIILIQSIPTFFTGEVIVIDKKNGTFTIKTLDEEEEVTFDYERSTSSDEYQPDTDKMRKSGLSRMNEGDILQVWAEVEDDGETYTAINLLRLPSDLFEPTSDDSDQVSSSASPEASADEEEE